MADGDSIATRWSPRCGRAANVQALEFLRAAIGKLPGDQPSSTGSRHSRQRAAPVATVARLRRCSNRAAGFAHLRAKPEEGPRLARKLMHPAAELLPRR